jgi:ribokinase
MKFPAAGETVTGQDLQTVPGGKGANQACAAARLGAQSTMVGCIGKDTFGEQAFASLRTAGVDVNFIPRPERATGTAMINIRPDGENTIVLSPGANASLDPASALSEMPSLAPGDCVLLQLEIPLETVTAVADAAQRQGATVFLDPAPFQPLPAQLLANVDWLTPNQTESAAMRNVHEEHEPSLDELRAIAEAIRTTGPRGVVLKLGAHGIYVSTAAKDIWVEGFAVKAVDTTAAGDVFNAAFAVALSEGRSVAEAARFGNAAGALSVTRIGAQSSIPERREVDDFLSTQTTLQEQCRRSA